MFNKYIEYKKDNPNNYWFKNKMYGWGWIPVKKEGWLVILIFILTILSFSSLLEKKYLSEKNFFYSVIFFIILLIIICYKKGEKPRWMWGIPKKTVDKKLKN